MGDPKLELLSSSIACHRQEEKCMNFRLPLAAAALLTVNTALALPSTGGGDGGPVDPNGDPPVDPQCALHSTASMNATPASIKLGQNQSATLTWSVSIPANCKNPGPLTLNGAAVATQGSITVQPMSSTAYVLLLNGVRLALTQLNVELPSTVHQRRNAGVARSADSGGRHLQRAGVARRQCRDGYDRLRGHLHQPRRDADQ